MNSVIRLIFCIPPVAQKKKEFEIKLIMVNPDVVRMDMKSFRRSAVVKQQAKAALNSLYKS